MRHCMGIIFVIMSALRPGDCFQCGQIEFEKPYVYKGESASLIYTPVDAVAPVKWFMYKQEAGFPILLYPNETVRPSTKYTESKTKERYILKISEIELADAGYYAVFCGQHWTLVAKLEVLVTKIAPSDPEFRDVEDIYNCSKCLPARLNVKMTVRCFTVGGSEPVELSMFKSGKLLSSVDQSKDLHNKTNTIAYSFTPTRDNFDTVFKCTVKNPALNVKKFVTTKLYIKVDPESVHIKTQPTKENETSNVQCTTINGRPPIRSLFYMKNKLNTNIVNNTKTIQSGYTYNVTTAVQTKVTRQDNQASMRCCIDSPRRVCSNKEYLNVMFPPQSVVLSELSKVSEENGDTVLQLKCDVDESNPKSIVYWQGVNNLPSRLLEEKYVDHTKTHGWTYTTSWMFNLTKEDRHREITCQVKNSEFSDLRLQQSYKPYITYSPVITISENRIKTVYIRDDVILSCYVDSNPLSVITWYNETEKIKETNRTKSLDLHLFNVTIEHSQTYTCSARNGIGGTKSRNVTLTVNVGLNPSEKSYNEPSNEGKSNSLVGAIIGGAVIISITIVAVVVSVILWKKRNHTAPKSERTQQVRDEHRNESSHLEGNDPTYKNVLASNEQEAENASEYEYIDGGDHINNEYERLQNLGDKRVYAALDTSSDFGARRLHKVSQPKPEIMKIETHTV